MSINSRNLSSLDGVLKLASSLNLPLPEMDKSTETNIAEDSSVTLVDHIQHSLDIESEINEVRQKIIDTQRFHQASDILDSEELDKKADTLENLQTHLSHIISDRQSLMKRIKEPYTGEYIILEPEYQQKLTELIPSINKTVSTLPESIEDILWMDQVELNDLKLDEINQKITTLAATYSSYADLLSQMRSTFIEFSETST
ncbi:hypothetical protein K7432_015351 [Basidiobolus ranarum]|uniref:Dynactin subunit 3 n=1 Tax=Basidiobolus ranarum TaxID=34480 RepID=A0ABR2WGC8_9FUNG